MIEHEARVLNVDPADVEQRVLAAGGRLTSPRRLMRRYVFNVPGQPTRWVRLRDNGNTVTLTSKRQAHDGLDGCHEVEVTVDDFGAAYALLGTLGFQSKAYQESYRTSLVIEGAAVEIDQWPALPALAEIEASSADEVIRIAALLGYTEDELTTEGIMDIYARAGVDLNTIPVLRFG